jgi:hypothetical protein
MPATSRGVYHNLKESKYVISNKEVTFFFSSLFTLNKFLDGYHDFRKRFNKKIDMLCDKTPLNFDVLADCCFYQQVEKRGFRARIKGVDLSCQDLYQYALRKMTDKNTKDWLEMPRTK